MNIQYAARRLVWVARPGSAGAARRSVDELRRVRDGDWPPGAGQLQPRDPALAACGLRPIPPFWRSRQRGRAATATTPSLAPCRRHRSRPNHCTNPDKARAGGLITEVGKPLPRQRPPRSLLTLTKKLWRSAVLVTPNVLQLTYGAPRHTLLTAFDGNGNITPQRIMRCRDAERC